LKGGGGSGITTLDGPTARSLTANWIPPQVKDPYSINWNLGIQHSFGKNYTAEINYVGTRGRQLSFQDIITVHASVTPTNFLPTYLQAPDQATLNALPLQLNTDSAGFPIVGTNDIWDQGFVNGGFGCPAPCTPFITAFVPAGWSIYHGLQSSLTRRFTNGLTFQGAYTWSHNIDNSTADFHSTDLTPRRPQDFFSFGQSDKANSALDRAQRFTLAMVYEMPYPKDGSWLVKNIVGNWQFSPVYTYETGEWVTVQSGRDSNLNVDSAGDRGTLNPGGVRGTGTDVTALCRVAACSDPTAGPVVAYVVNNPSAQYIRTGSGAFTSLGRNTLQTPGTNNFDLAVYKNLKFGERMAFRLGAQFANIVNHPQFIPGSNPGYGLGVNDVNSFSSVGTTYKNFVNPGRAAFNHPQDVFASNARTIALTAKFSF